jgi:aspartyl aminopeptidase
MSELVSDLLSYLDASVTPYHAVARARRMLEDAGFVDLREADRWALNAGDRAYVVRGGTSLVAFVCGQVAPQDAGFVLVGAHTDSPNLRLKPNADVSRAGYLQLGVEVYGGVLLSTWLDRDLSIAGRVLVDEGSDHHTAHLVDFGRPLLRIPNLAIHLNRNVNTEGLVLNAQQHLAPVLGLSSPSPIRLQHLLAEELRHAGQPSDPDRIVGFDLSLYDTQRATTSGVRGEFIHSARLDNLASCFSALDALCGADEPCDATRGIVLYDHEEVGSLSSQGAYSSFLRQVLDRVTHACGGDGPDAFARAMARSFLISADMAHAVHPNYADKHEPNHQPVLGGGPVIKSNANQSYASDGEGMARFAQLCREAQVTPQHYVVRSDLACGSTIGPITAGELGIRTVDVGSPLLSMHSIREMAACSDADALSRVLSTFFSA